MNHVSSGGAARARRDSTTSILRTVSLLVAFTFVAGACQSGVDDGLGSEGNPDPALAIGVDLGNDDDSESPSRTSVLAATGSVGTDESDESDASPSDGAATDGDGDGDGDDEDGATAADPTGQDSDDADDDATENRGQGETTAGNDDSDSAGSTTSVPNATTSTTSGPAPGAPTTAAPTTAASTTAAPTTSAPAPTTTTAPAPSPGDGFKTLPVGAALPSGAACASRVKAAPETRPENASYNARRGTGSNDWNSRVDGNYVGTTDEIIQWAACKWGLDEDVARAQAAKESWWDMSAGGDRSSDQSECHPDLRTSDGSPCPESIGLLQVRWLYHKEAFEDSNAIRSTAYNVDYAFAVWRDCFEGNLSWLRPDGYTAGDADGCLGAWFSGQWYPPDAVVYIEAVHDLRKQRIWDQANFKE